MWENCSYSYRLRWCFWHQISERKGVEKQIKFKRAFFLFHDYRRHHHRHQLLVFTYEIVMILRIICNLCATSPSVCVHLGFVEWTLRHTNLFFSRCRKRFEFVGSGIIDCFFFLENIVLDALWKHWTIMSGDDLYPIRIDDVEKENK